MAKIGRPRAQFDLELVERTASLQATHEELATVLKCSVYTIKDRIANDEEFSTAYKRGKEEGKLSLRRWQVHAAKSGNVSMLIWLGKQYLGQSDKQETMIGGTRPLKINIELDKLNGEENDTINGVISEGPSYCFEKVSYVRDNPSDIVR